MRASPGLALIAALVLAALPLAAEPSGARAVLSAELRLKSADPAFGGLSGVELSDDGTQIVALSDRGMFFTGRISRQDGRLVAVAWDDPQPVRSPSGGPVRGALADPEGLALRPDGKIVVSFEGHARLWFYDRPGGRASWLPDYPDLRRFAGNGGLEAVAIDAEGAIWTLPEQPGGADWPFPLFRYADGSWSQPFAIARRGGFVPVGADFGPDGLFYLLERDFAGILGFRSRVRRFTLGAAGPQHEEILLTTRAGLHDNLEGLAVWRDDTGLIRLTMVADDNFKPFQHSDLVEYVVAR